jgi:hypothetical protein
MKFTSIVFAALVAATQFSSTFAQLNIARDTSASTYLGTAVTINVSGTDEVTDITGPYSEVAVKFALDNGDMTKYTLSGLTTPSAGGKVTVVTSTVDDESDQIEYTSKDGFTGDETFDYQFLVFAATSTTQYGSIKFKSGVATVTVTVTVTVSPTPIKQTFEIPGLVSSGNAVKYNHEGLFNTVAFTPGAPDANSFNAIVKPVIGGSADFAANTSTEAVNNMFAKSWASFINFKFLRGGN